MNKVNPINPQRKLTSPTSINGLLSLKPVIPFENHPSARGLMKKESSENIKNNFLNIDDNSKEKNKNFSKKSSDIRLTLNSIEDKIYQNEVYFQINDNYSEKNISTSQIINPKKNTFTDREKEFDNDITSSIQKNEGSDVIINKFKNFANIKNSKSNNKDCNENIEN